MAGPSSQLIIPRARIWIRMNPILQENATSDCPQANGFVEQDRTRTLLPRWIAQQDRLLSSPPSLDPRVGGGFKT